MTDSSILNNMLPDIFIVAVKYNHFHRRRHSDQRPKLIMTPRRKEICIGYLDLAKSRYPIQIFNTFKSWSYIAKALSLFDNHPCYSRRHDCYFPT